jgi:hypothetical protein
MTTLRAGVVAECREIDDASDVIEAELSRN